VFTDAESRPTRHRNVLNLAYTRPTGKEKPPPNAVAKVTRSGAGRNLRWIVRVRRPSATGSDLHGPAPTSTPLVDEVLDLRAAARRAWMDTC
jgi:hypothetical protein